MVDYLGGLVVLAYRHHIFYFDAETHMTAMSDLNEQEISIR